MLYLLKLLESIFPKLRIMEHRENNQLSCLVNHIQEIQAQLGVQFLEEQLLIQAFIHKSFLNEFGHLFSESYERLEFLGDAILSASTGEYLFRTRPEADEGELSQLKAQWVSQKSLCQAMSALGVSHFLLTGKGEKMHKLYQQEAVLADLFEAIIGALFLDQGWEVAKQFILSKHCARCESLLPIHDNPKAALQEWCMKHKLGLPCYTVVKEEGPQHDPTFTVDVLVQNQVIYEASGKTNRQAETEAAREELKIVQVQQ